MSNGKTGNPAAVGCRPWREPSQEAAGHHDVCVTPIEATGIAIEQCGRESKDSANS